MNIEGIRPRRPDQLLALTMKMTINRKAGAVAVVVSALTALGGVNRAEASPPLPPLRGLEEVDHSKVTVRGGFWGKRLKTHLDLTIDHSLNMLENDGHMANFDRAAGVADGECTGHAAFDSDLHKVLEGAMYTLAYGGDERLMKRVDGVLDRVLAAQQEDGFLIAFYILKDQDKRWDNMAMHQTYNAGHFFEMAVEHEKLTGDPKALDASKRFADNIDRVFGPGKRYDVDGHQEVELALIKLYRATGERRYLDLARFFLDERGHLHGTARKPFDPATEVKGKGPMGQRLARQDHKPVVEQFEAVGHAVRAGYMYAAMTDVVRFTEEAPGYENALDHLWEDVVGRKMYITGGLGTQQYGFEGFGDPYVLIHDGAYAETCAAVAHALWQYRMNLLKGDAKYIDVMELALHNGVLAGFSIAGNGYFYENRLVKNKGQRGPWKGLSCCPTNIARIIPQIGGLAYARGKEQILVNLYLAGEATIKMDSGVTVKLSQETDYPWDGGVQLIVTPDRAARFDLQLRIPGWAQGRPVPSDLYNYGQAKVPPVGLKVNGQATDATPQADGYVHLNREWKAGDVISLDLPMPVQRVYSNEKLMTEYGKGGQPPVRGRERVTLMRGPIVYCLEEQDHPGEKVADLILTPDAPLKAEFRPEFLGGVTVLTGEALGTTGNRVSLTAVPYYAWANRISNPMTVWINTEPGPGPGPALKP